MNEPAVYLFHGFNVSDGGEGTTDQLRPYLERDGFNVHECDYLWKGLLGVRMCNKSMARLAAALVAPGSIGIGHSNGCALLHHAAHYGAPFSRVIYINPALNNDADLAPHINQAMVISCASDMTVWVAKFIPGSAWGSMGQDGYVGSDRRYLNVRRHDECDHSDFFTKLPDLYPVIGKFLQERQHVA